MPRKPASPALADEHAAPGGAAAVDRALSLLAAFRKGDAPLTLAELAARTKLYKSTALRLLASLEHTRLLQRSAAGLYTLGPEVTRLNAIYAASFSLEAQALPVLRDLVARTRESAAFHVRHGEQRLCLVRVDSPQLLRDHIRVGDVLPLDRGSGGRVLLAFSGAKGKLYEQARRDGVVELSGHRVADVAGVSAPVFDAQGELAGALTLSFPVTRRRPSFAGQVREAARTLSRALGAP